MKKIIALTIVLLIVFSLVGCKSKGYTDDEEVTVIADDKTQADIQENIGANEQEQKAEKAEDTSKENVDKSDKTTETSTNTEDISNDVTDTQQNQTSIEDTVTNVQVEKDDVNQLELDLQKNPYGGDDTSRLKFKSIEEMVECIKEPQKFKGDVLKEAITELDLVNYKNSQNEFEQQGGKGDFRFERFKTANLEYFYKIKDILGYTISDIEVSREIVRIYYSPISVEKVTENDKIMVTYYRPDDFVTDSYFEDYMEYHKVKEKKGKILDKNDSVGGLLYGDDFLYTKHERSDFAVIKFPVENTMIEIFSNSELANYEALKKLCVAEKVVVK